MHMHRDKNIYQQVSLGSILCLILVCLFAVENAFAAGTPAGTVITSTVSATCTIGGAPQGPVFASAAFTVDRRINLVVTKIADVATAPTLTNVALPFLITNTGNTPLRFALQAQSRATNTWSMNNVRIYRDDNSNGVWNSGDTLYSDAGTFNDVASDATLTVLIVSDTPAGVANGQSAIYDLIAAAVDAGTLNLAAQTAGPDTVGVDTVFSDSAGSAAGDAAHDGRHSAFGIYTVNSTSANVIMNKTVAILDQWGGNQPIPGATLRYTITVSVTGSGTANNVVITDALPTNTASIPNTLRLNGAAITDTNDADAGDVGQTTLNAVTMRLGNMTSATPVQTIRFDVKIN
jgi:uncharacterized repeat protein (TIGR01451 family)